MKLALPVIDGDRLAKSRLDAAGRTFLEQHVDDLLGRAVAEELTQGLFMPRDTMPVD